MFFLDQSYLVTVICADSRYLVTILVMDDSRGHSRFKNNNKSAAAQHSFEVAVKKVMIMDYNRNFVTLITLVNSKILQIFQLFFS